MAYVYLTDKAVPYKKISINLLAEIENFHSYAAFNVWAKNFSFIIYLSDGQFFCSDNDLHTVCGYSPYRQASVFTCLKQTTKKLDIPFYVDTCCNHFFKIDDCEEILENFQKARNTPLLLKNNARNFLSFFKEKIAPLCTTNETKARVPLDTQLANESKYVAAPNGTKIWIYKDREKEFVKLTSIAQALGYSAFVVDNSLLAVVLKNHSFTVYKRPLAKGAKPSYLVNILHVVPILQSFVRLTLVTKQTNSLILAKMDEARAEAQQLIDVFVREGYGKKNDCADEESSKKADCSNEETKQMETKNETQNNMRSDAGSNLHAVTVPEIEDIGERANAIVKVFGVSMKDALRAATQLKAQEINRDLSPLLDLLN